MDRRDFMYAGAVLTGGLLAGCATKVPLKEFEQKVAMPGEEGFLEESNLEKWMDRYWGAKDFIQDISGLNEISVHNYDDVVKSNNDVKIVSFMSYDVPRAYLRQALALGHVARDNEVPLYVSFSDTKGMNFANNNQKIYAETQGLQMSSEFDSSVSIKPWDSGRDIYPVTLFVANGESKDFFWQEMPNHKYVPLNAAFSDYVVNKLKESKSTGEDYKQVLKGRHVMDLVSDPKLDNIVSEYHK